MESESASAQGQMYREQPQGVGLRAAVEGDEGQHEKKPVLKKVKEKVKKIKDKTIGKKKHGQGEDNLNGHDNVTDDDEGYEEEDEEGSPEVINGRPVHGGTLAGALATGQEDRGLDQRDIPGKTTGSAQEDPDAPKYGSDTSRMTDPNQLSHPPVSTGDSALPHSFQAMTISDQPQEPKEAYADPTGTHDKLYREDKPKESEYSPPTGTHDQFSAGDKPKQSDYSPLSGTHDQFSTGDKPKQSDYSPLSGTHDQLSPEDNKLDRSEYSPPAGSHDQFSPQDKSQQNEYSPASGTQNQPEPMAEDSRSTGTQDQVYQEDKPQQGATYTEKLASTATAAKGAAVSAAVGSTEYARQLASTAYEKVAEAGAGVKGKIQQQRGTTGTEGSDGTAATQQNKGPSVKEYLVEKLSPGEEDKALSEVISESMRTGKEEKMKTPEAGLSADASGGGQGMVQKIKGAVTSLLGAGAGGGSQASPAPETRLEGSEPVAGSHEQQGGQKQEKDVE